MRYISDRKLAQMPSLAGLPDEDVTRIVSTADRVYQHLIRTEDIGMESDALFDYASRNGIDPTDMARALDLLVDQRRVRELRGPDDPPAPPRPERP